MLVNRALRWLAVVGTVAMATTVAIHSVRADDDAINEQVQQEQQSDAAARGAALSGAAKTKHTAIHASGPVTIAGTPCASPSAAIECYTISSSALKQGTVSNGT